VALFQKRLSPAEHEQLASTWLFTPATCSVTPMLTISPTCVAFGGLHWGTVVIGVVLAVVVVDIVVVDAVVGVLADVAVDGDVPGVELEGGRRTASFLHISAFIDVADVSFTDPQLVASQMTRLLLPAVLLGRPGAQGSVPGEELSKYLNAEALLVTPEGKNRPRNISKPFLFSLRNPHSLLTSVSLITELPDCSEAH
jgi:hypothetical protein